MTPNIVELARDLQQHLAPNSKALSDEEQRLHDIGRLQATQVIDDLRMGEKSASLLMCAFWVIQKQDSAAILQGFLEECQECLAEVPR